MKIQFTLNAAEFEIWPVDKPSRDQFISLMARNDIGYRYMPTTMGTMTFRFHNKEDYNRALDLAQSYQFS
jgi:hypothetical protein